MSTAKHIDRVGASAGALRVGKFRRTATRMAASVGDAAPVVFALFWQCLGRRSQRRRP
jgi:hypothetical protein